MRAFLTILAGFLLSAGVAFALFLSLALIYALINMGIGLSETFEEAAYKGLVFSGAIGWMWWFDGWRKKRRARQ